MTEQINNIIRINYNTLFIGRRNYRFGAGGLLSPLVTAPLIRSREKYWPSCLI